MVGQGNLEKEKSGNLKINGFGSLQKNFFSTVHWERMFFL